MHARMERSGARNPKYDYTSPFVANQYLNQRFWQRATSRLKNLGILPGRDYFGVRVTEPHHDVTPHWHILAFVRPSAVKTFISVLKQYALAESPDEPGAARRRFDVKKEIGPNKGSAAGYIAKYISKNLDGHGVDADRETKLSGRERAERATAWARIWRIRQFQFFGVGSITPFRELYRLRRLPAALGETVAELWESAQEKNFGQYKLARDAREIRLSIAYEAAPSARYPWEEVRRLTGLRVGTKEWSGTLVTRTDRWRLRFRLPPGSVPLDPIQ
jgi:hypothetical protein